MKMKRVLPMVTVFLLGGGLYCCLEVIWRGFSHPSMAVVGGMCVVCIFYMDRLRLPLAYKMLLCGMTVTVIEGLSGVVLNILLGWQVWDYSQIPFNIYGQICIWFFLLWTLLSFPAMIFCRTLQRYIFS